MNQFDIDLVYLWVDGNDPEWLAKKQSFVSESEKSGVDCKGRFANNDELKYSLRAVELYAPWIRNIFIVTDNQRPEWLDISNSKIKIIDHSEILPPESLPTFNSVVLEHFLFRIPGLAEHFLFANDDMFINRPVIPADFFTPDGRPYMRMNRRPMRRLTLWLKEKVLGKQISNYNLSIRNAAQLFQEKFAVYYGCKTHHNIDVFLKSVYREAYEDVFCRDIGPTLSNHVRADNDIQRNLYSYYHIYKKKGKLVYVGNKSSFRMHIDNHRHYEKLRRYSPTFFCLNDSQYACDEDRRLVKSFLEKRFPAKSSFEI